MHDDLPVTDLVKCARNGNKQAWDALVDRYAPLIWSICRRNRVSRADATDVGQRIWQQLVDQLATIRDPAAIPGWLATITQQECRRIRSVAYRPHAGGQALHAGNIPARQTGTAEQELLVAERNAALRAAFGHLPPSCRQLLALLIAQPPVPYAQISVTLGIPVESIGPYRARCLEMLRHDPAIAALINADAASTIGEMHGQAGMTTAR
jgi:RNA polymerase sigma factor (sigma-70 family)